MADNKTIHVDIDDGDDIGLEMERLADYSRDAWRRMRDERDALQKRVEELEDAERNNEATIEDLRDKLRDASERIAELNERE